MIISTFSCRFGGDVPPKAGTEGVEPAAAEEYVTVRVTLFHTEQAIYLFVKNKIISYICAAVQ